MAKKAVDETVQDIKTLLKKKNLIVGTERAMKELMKGKLGKIFLTTNVPDKIRADINYYGRLAGTEILNLKYNNEELGEICKKPFPISVLGLLK